MALESRVSVIFPLLGSVFSRHLVSLLRVPFGFGSPLSPVLPRCSVTCCPSGRTSFPSFGSYRHLARLLFVSAVSFAASSGGSCAPRPGRGSLVAVCPFSALLWWRSA